MVGIVHMLVSDDDDDDDDEAAAMVVARRWATVVWAIRGDQWRQTSAARGVLDDGGDDRWDMWDMWDT
jgi:hypothetical protein